MTNQTALRDRIRLAIARQWLDEMGSDRTVDELDDAEFGEFADAVLAVLPAPADKATVYREAADAIDNSERLRDFTDDHMSDINEAANELRRMADETATTETQPPHRPVALATPCTVCGHTYNWHTRRHGQCEVVPLGVGRCGCTGFVPGERPEPVDPRRILGADPDFAAGARQDGSQP